MIGVGVVGAGYWGPNLIRNFAAARGARLTAVADRDDQRLQRVSAAYPGVRVYDEYARLLRDADTDCVAVATPAGSHFELARQALAEGKHVFVEKPLATRIRECEQLIELATRKGLCLMVGHTFEYNAAVLRIEEYIRAQELGEIYYLYSQRLNLGVVRRDVNALWNLAPHDISIVLRWLGEDPATVGARGFAYLQPGIEDVVYLDMEFPSGIAAHVHCSWLDPAKVRRMTVVGSRKMVVYDDASSDAKIRLYDKGIDRHEKGDSLGDFDSFGSFQLIKRAGDVLIPRLEFTEPLKRECQHFVDCVEQGTVPITDGQNGLRVVRVLEAATRSLYRGGTPVTLAGAA